MCNAFPEAEKDGFLEKTKNRIENIEVGILLIALLNESLNKFEDAGEVKLLLFFFLSLEGSFCSINVLTAHNSTLFALMAIPSANVLDGLDGSELAIVNVNIMSNSHKWLMHVGNREQPDASIPKTCLIDLSDLLV